MDGGGEGEVDGGADGEAHGGGDGDTKAGSGGGNGGKDGKDGDAVGEGGNDGGPIGANTGSTSSAVLFPTMLRRSSSTMDSLRSVAKQSMVVFEGRAAC